MSARHIAAFEKRLNGHPHRGVERPAGSVRNPALRPRHSVSGTKVASADPSGQLLSVAGGGDTIAALAHAGVEQDFTYVSTAGGAFLEWLEGKTLPGVEALSTK